MPQEPFLFILLLLTLFSLLAAAAAAILAAKAAGNGRTDMDGLYNALDRQRTALSEEARQTRQESSRAAMEAVESLGRTLAAGQQQQSRELSIRQDSLQKTVAELTRGIDGRFAQFMAQNEQQLSGIRSTVENRLSAMQEDNAAKLEQMRKTVDERLEKTLETRLGQSFKMVSERLEQVYKGLGEMQTLAAGVGDLKKVLSNVKTRGLLGEVQLGAILEDILAPGQYETNVATRRDSRNPVEFAVVLPGDGETPVYLPIDAKFPADAYIQLTQAYDLGDREAIDEAARLLKTRVKAFARDIRDKYIDPPHTTDFAVMFLPFEGLYAQVLQLDLVEQLLVAAHHDGQGTVNGLGLAAGHGGVQHLHALFSTGGGDLLGCQGGNGAHVHQHGARLGPLQYAVFTHDHSLDMRRVGQHSDDKGALLRHILGRSARLGPGGHHVVHVGGDYIIDHQLMSRLHQVLSHGFSHDPQSDKSDLHI